MKIAHWMPGLGTLATYKASFLPHDLAAGLTLGAVMVPVGLAYGELAGLPLAGLYGSMLPLLAYALFGSSRQLIVGPDTAMAALVAVVVVPLAPGDPGRLALLAAGLGVMVGMLCLLGGVLRLGFVANFLSKPVIVGFMHGLALVIVVAQLPKVLGLKSDGETTLEQAVSLLHRLGDTNFISLGIGIGTFAAILLCRRFAPRVPGAVLALAVSGLAVVLLGLDKQGVAVVGRIPTGLPGLSLPAVTLADFEALLPVALVAALLSFSDTVVTARAFAARNRYRIDANQELLAIGAANLVSGLSQGLPISASDSRTAVAEAAGGRTQVTSAIAAVVVAGVMLWLAEFLYYLPSAALGGLLVASAWGLCDTAEFRRLWRFRGISLAGALVTMLGVVALGVMEGILIGVVFSLVLLLRALAFPPDAFTGAWKAWTWAATKAVNSAELMGLVTKPRSPSRSMIFGSANTSAIALFSFAWASGGKPVGAERPTKFSATSFGKPRSVTSGTSGADGAFCVEVSASMRSLPSFANGNTSVSVTTAKSSWPAIMSWNMGAAPR